MPPKQRLSIAASHNKANFREFSHYQDAGLDTKATQAVGLGPRAHGLGPQAASPSQTDSLGYKITPVPAFCGCNLRIIRRCRHIPTLSCPIGMEELTARPINSLISMSAKIIPLGLQ